LIFISDIVTLKQKSFLTRHNNIIANIDNKMTIITMMIISMVYSFGLLFSLYKSIIFAVVFTIPVLKLLKWYFFKKLEKYMTPFVGSKKL
jgi:hypothetical protein